jgi:hypothetical protein
VDAILGIAKALIVAAFQREPPVKPIVVNSHGDVILRPDHYTQSSSQSEAPVLTYGADGKDHSPSSSTPKD